MSEYVIYTDYTGLTIYSGSAAVYMGKFVGADTFELSKAVLKAWHLCNDQGVVNVILRSIFGDIPGSIRIVNLPMGSNRFDYKPVNTPDDQGVLAIVGDEWRKYSFIFKDGYENSIKEICKVLTSPTPEKKPQGLYGPYTFSSWPPPYENINYNPPEEDVRGKILGMFGTKKVKYSTASLHVSPHTPDWSLSQVSGSVAEQLTKDAISTFTVRKTKENPSSLISYLARRFELTGNNAKYVLHSEEEYKDFKDKVKSDKLYLYVFAKDLAELRLFNEHKQMLIKVFIDNALCLVESHHVQIVLVGNDDVYRKRARGAYWEKDVYAELRLGKIFIRGSNITKSGEKQLQFMNFIRRTFAISGSKSEDLPDDKKENTVNHVRILDTLDEYFDCILGPASGKSVFVHISDRYLSWLRAIDPKLMSKVFILSGTCVPPSMAVFLNTRTPVRLFFRDSTDSGMMVCTPSTVGEFALAIDRFLAGEK